MCCKSKIINDIKVKALRYIKANGYSILYKYTSKVYIMDKLESFAKMTSVH